MPILPREADVFPPELLHDDAALAGGDGSWWALYTMARREKDLLRQLRGLGIGFYAPQIARKNRSPAGRMRTSFVPLFPSYVFLRGTDDQRRQALATQCVSRCLSVPDGGRLVRDLRQIHRLIELNAPLTMEARIEPGQRVRVRNGPMLGLEGTVVQRRGGDWLVVAVEFLQQGASVLLEDCRVEVI